MYVLFLREPIGTDMSNNRNTSLAIDHVTTFYAGRWSFVPTALKASSTCPYHSDGEHKRSRPAPYRMTSYFFWFARDKKQFFRCVVTSSRHSYRNTVSVRPREDPQSRRPSFDKEQASTMITWLFLFLRPLTLVSADP